MSSALIGKNRVSEAEVLAVPEVDWTDTFHPIHHKLVISALRTSLDAFGLEVMKAEYVLASEGQKMFSVWDLNNGTSELCWSLGIRNSMDKSLAFSIACGSRVFVCENLAFSGEYVTFRRHTKGLDVDELEFMAFRAMKGMIPKLQAFQSWHESLKEHSLSEADFRILLVEILAQGVVPASKFSQLYDLYMNVYGGTIFGLHESVTDVLRESNLLYLPKKSEILNQIVNQYIDNLGSANNHPLGEFYQRRCCLPR